MNPITHYIAGYFIGKRAGLDKHGLRALTFLAVIPDIDFIFIIGGTEGIYGLHRTLTHSLLAAVIFTAVVVVIYRFKRGRAEALKLLPFALLSSLSHLALDLVSFGRSSLSYLGQQTRPAYLEGVELFWPLSETRYGIVSADIATQLVVTSFMLVMIALTFAYIAYLYRKGEKAWTVWTELFSREKDVETD